METRHDKSSQSCMIHKRAIMIINRRNRKQIVMMMDNKSSSSQIMMELKTQKILKKTKRVK